MQHTLYFDPTNSNIVFLRKLFLKCLLVTHFLLVKIEFSIISLLDVSEGVKLLWVTESFLLILRLSGYSPSVNFFWSTLYELSKVRGYSMKVTGLKVKQIGYCGTYTRRFFPSCSNWFFFQRKRHSSFTAPTRSILYMLFWQWREALFI